MSAASANRSSRCGVLPGPVVRARQVEQQLAAERLVLGAEAVEQLERPPEVAHRDLGRDLLQRALPGLVAVPHRLLRGALVRGRAEMVREFGGGDAGAELQRLADPLVQRRPAAPAQLLGGHPPGQGVREPPAIGFVLELRDQARPRRLLQQVDGRGVRSARPPTPAGRRRTARRSGRRSRASRRSRRSAVAAATGPCRGSIAGSRPRSRPAGPHPGRTRRPRTGAWPSPAGRRGCPRSPTRARPPSPTRVPRTAARPRPRAGR